jgi:NHLM bacteriocin system ABC transporter ATP-binding protein
MTVSVDPVQATSAAAESRARAVDLAGLEDVLWLESGRAHVFATPVREGAPTGGRQFLFSIEAPGAIFGLVAGSDDLRFEAVLDPYSETRRLEGRRFWVRTSPGEPQSAVAAVDGWIKGWLGACAQLLTHHRPPRDLAATEEVVLEPGRVLDGAHGVIWRRVGYGHGALFDLAPVGGEDLCLFPLASGAWVSSFDPLRLLPLSSRRLFDQSALAQALAEAQTAFTAVIGAGLGLARVDEAQRRDRRRGRLAADTRRVVGDLGKMVGLEAPVTVDRAANQALFSAVRLVAQRLGVRAKSPISVRQAQADLEPSLGEILRASSLQSRPVLLPEGWQRTGVDDLLAWQGKERRPVALLRDRRGRYRLHDPAQGGSAPLDAQLAATLADDAVVLYQPLPDRPLKLRDLLFFGTQQTLPDLATLGGAAILAAAVGSVPSIAAKLVFDTLIPQQQTGLLLQIGAALTLFAVISAIFVFTGQVAMARIRSRASTRLKAALWDRVLRQPMPFLARYTAPDLTLRLGAAENIVGAFHAMGQQSMTTLGVLIANVIAMLWLSPPAAAAAIGVLALLAGVTWIAALAQKRAFTQGEQAEGAVSTFVHALTNGVRKLRLAGAEERAFVKWGDRFTRSRAKLIQVRKVTNAYAVFLAAFNALGLAGLFFVVSRLAGSPVGPGTFLGFVTAFGIALNTTAALGRTGLQLAFQLASAPYMQPVLDAVPLQQSNKSHPGPLSGAVEIANLSFRYGHEGPLTISGVSFAAAPGEFVAIVGPTGCGKSTLLKLLLGLEAPLAGAVLYDQRDLASLDLDAVRRQVGVVMQRAQLMPTSLFENVRGASDISLDEAWEAASLAGIADDIRAMPMGMYTLVTEGSQTLSGGQRQRLALARALARRPAVLLLDEATSALDNVVQAEVMRNLAELACTRIVVAHRLSTIRQADRIVVLDAGEVVEVGDYENLMAAGGLFARLAAGQQAG